MALPPQLQKVLQWPAFVLSVLVLYWSAAVVGLMYKIQWLQFKGPRNDLLGWARGMQAVFQFKVLRIGNGQLYRGDCIYLLNHRSWADMLVDQFVTEGRAMFMSRWAMFAVFPPLMATMTAMRVILMFKRGSIADKDGFNKWIDQKLAESPQTALVVYPEGHRSTQAQSLPLKRGMLHYAYSRKLPVQVITGLNKEAILSEKHMVVRLGQKVGVAFSGLVEPSKFDSFEAFMGEVQRAWDTQWQQVFSTRLGGLPELHPGPPDFDYPRDIRWKLAACIPANILLLATTLYFTLRWAAMLLALCGPLRTPLAALAAAWALASFAQAWRPVNAVEAEERLHRRWKESTAREAGAKVADAPAGKQD